MTAGVPGLGLSGLFALLSALVLPVSRRGRVGRRQVVRLFGFAVVISATVLGSWEVAVAVVSSHSGQRGHQDIPVILISLALLNLIVVVAELLDHAFHVVPTPTPEPIPRLRPRPLLRVA